MDEERWSAVDRYITDHLVSPDAVLESALQVSEAAGLRAISVSPNQGKLLFLMAKAMGAQNVLELGTLGGTAPSGWRARCLPAAAS